MRSFLLFISFLFLFGETAFAQAIIDSSGVQKTDSLPEVKDSVNVNVLENDSLSLKSAVDTNLKTNPGMRLSAT